MRCSDKSCYVADCVETHFVTQGATFDETTANLHEAVEDEKSAALGMTANPVSIVAMEQETALSHQANVGIGGHCGMEAPPFLPQIGAAPDRLPCDLSGHSTHIWRFTFHRQ